MRRYIAAGEFLGFSRKRDDGVKPEEITRGRRGNYGEPGEEQRRQRQRKTGPGEGTREEEKDDSEELLGQSTRLLPLITRKTRFLAERSQRDTLSNAAVPTETRRRVIREVRAILSLVTRTVCPRVGEMTGLDH